ncbi:two pore domain potassium channel family protein [Halomonas sp. MCCC 1A17488]|uniref:Two pore domain potassium channel family protein n=1 Tax=Billgrantia sulfidoxydans TaxID=2733484 RepID=A0ABX7W4Z4_9GAMM|nr:MULTISPECIES: potassium channel family protein [Halomonas]MCE8015585.1 two pore domain potassium channel family protein [Halomonas sp. MCCC 1A17488]MCG3238918.1 two pore domain potassium channel family protein [Halomonas sp. MCCC 1A17488]QPP51128.1 two pore domain potassium channel family protein [Halomonas sp. SS10-MC5]QTP54697.1 two pore domain potassium channel family protein [Halomonas sulfidoxydans]
MSTFIALSGFLLLGLVCYDAVQTTLSAARSGPITRLLGRFAWYTALWFYRRFSRHGLLRAVGPWVTVSLMLVWVGLIWLGWWLVFNSHPTAVFHPDSGTYANPVERLYYVGYTITTLGYGDFVAGGAKWQLLSVVAAANGFFLLTLAVTYILSVMSAVVQKRQLALSIHSLGATPADIVGQWGEEGDFSVLASQTDALKSTIISVGQQHLAYPILHYYHQGHAERALPVALFRLYQALVIVCHGSTSLAPSVRLQLQATLHALEDFLSVLSQDFVRPARHVPEIDAAWLPAAAGLDRSPEALCRYLETLEIQRLWLAYVHKDGWDWRTLWVNELT